MAVDRFPIEAGHIMMFARALGDENPDHGAAGPAAWDDIVAPPTFVAGGSQYDPDNPLRWSPSKPWLGSTARQAKAEGTASAGANSLHAEQHYEYHQPIKPGDVLHAVAGEGRTWEKEGRRGGAMLFRENVLEWRNEKDELVVTQRSVGVTVSSVPTQEAK